MHTMDKCSQMEKLHNDTFTVAIEKGCMQGPPYHSCICASVKTFIIKNFHSCSITKMAFVPVGVFRL